MIPPFYKEYPFFFVSVCLTLKKVQGTLPREGSQPDIDYVDDRGTMST